MSQREKKKTERKRRPKPVGPVTRKQQMLALRNLKAEEISANVANNIRAAVKQEVETQLKAIKDTMLDLIDRVVDCEARQNAVLMQRVKDTVDDEGDGDDRQERAEAVPVLDNAEVAPDERFVGQDCSGEDGAEGPQGG